jgi:antitoxin VapB
MKTAKLFQNGRSQAVRLPKEFRMPGHEVYVKKVGNAVVLLPTGDPWDAFESSLGQFPDDFLDERAQPELQRREDLFE